MASSTTPNAPAETEATTEAKTPRTNAREAGGKQVGAWFNPAEYEQLREARFVKRLDKDSDVVKAAVAEYVEKHLTASE